MKEIKVKLYKFRELDEGGQNEAIQQIVILHKDYDPEYLVNGEFKYGDATHKKGYSEQDEWKVNLLKDEKQEFFRNGYWFDDSWIAKDFGSMTEENAYRDIEVNVAASVSATKVFRVRNQREAIKLAQADGDITDGWEFGYPYTNDSAWDTENMDAEEVEE